MMHKGTILDYSKESDKVIYFQFAHVGYMFNIRKIDRDKADFISERYEALGIKEIMNSV